MNHIESIKLLSILSTLRRSAGPVSDASTLLSTLRALTSEQRHRLGDGPDSPVAVLKHHLAEQGQEAATPVLRELACLSIAALRGSSDPLAVFAPDQAGFTARRREQAATWVERASQVLRSFQSLPLACRQDLVEYGREVGVTLPLAHENATEENLLATLMALTALVPKLPPSLTLHEQITEQCRELTTTEGQGLAAFAVELLDSGGSANKELAEDILLRLACLVPNALDGIHQRLVQYEMFYPGELFRGADPETRDNLLHRIDDDAENRNHLLVALAWIGDGGVQERFLQWRQAPPVWASSIFIPAENYAMEAGWHLTKTGEPRRLYHAACYKLVPTQNAAEPDGIASPVSVVTPHEANCGWCGRPLVTLFDFDFRDDRLHFLSPHGRLCIATCERCTCYAPVFTEVDLAGHSSWSPLNRKPDFIGYDDEYVSLPQRRLMLGEARRTPFEAHFYVIKDGASQIGGHPTWEQDAEYPICPRCQEPMPCVGQLQTRDLGEPAEGVTYAFWCSPCGMAATSYQQT